MSLPPYLPTYRAQCNVLAQRVLYREWCYYPAVVSAKMGWQIGRYGPPVMARLSCGGGMILMRSVLCTCVVRPGLRDGGANSSGDWSSLTCLVTVVSSRKWVGKVELAKRRRWKRWGLMMDDVRQAREERWKVGEGRVGCQTKRELPEPWMVVGRTASSMEFFSGAGVSTSPTGMNGLARGSFS